MRLEARLSFALMGLVQATGYAGGLDSVQEKRDLSVFVLTAQNRRGKFEVYI